MKKEPKNFFYEDLALRQGARQGAKSFCFFFQKEVLPSFVSVNNNAGWYEMPPGWTAGLREKQIFGAGAASGIGATTARLFAAHGWHVGLGDQQEDALRALAAELGDMA